MMILMILKREYNDFLLFHEVFCTCQNYSIFLAASGIEIKEVFVNFVWKDKKKKKKKRNGGAVHLAVINQ